MPFMSCLDSFFDLAVFGAGYSGVAAAWFAASQGKRVLLVDARGDLLWESGRAFQTQTGPWNPDFRCFGEKVARATGLVEEWLDGAVAEVVANELLRDGPVRLLYYAIPVAVEMSGQNLAAVTVATNSGLRRLAARRWVDATEQGTLARLIEPALTPKTPKSLRAFIYLQQVRWRRAEEVVFDAPELPECRLTWRPSAWPNERIISIEMPGHSAAFAWTFPPTLKAARKQLVSEFGEAFVSHCSFEPYPLYSAGPEQAASATNLVLASPALAGPPVNNLVERYMLGLQAGRAVLELPACEKGSELLKRQVVAPDRMATTNAHVVVAGLGAGGALAAIAAGREGAEVLAFDPLAFPGGMGTGGGIPVYYFGVSGGLQNEVDERTREIMPLFAKQEIWGSRFHPDARRVILEEMLRQAGVRTLYGAALYAAEVRGGRVTSGHVATPGGPLRVDGEAWIDATGDGDLAAFAGAAFRLGRCGDGNLHAYTQSGGRFRLKDGRLLGATVNFDSGFVDPTDSEDLTRARVEGVHQHYAPAFNAIQRPTFIAPLIGIRQGRLVETDYALTLDDLMERRRFPDCIGFTGCHYDSHATDFEFESDEAMFFVWACGLSAARTACEMPYRMLLPKGLDNVWLACRALGVTDEAHPSVRMQRDLQRAGEACGIAAALALRKHCGSRAVPYSELRARLEKSGALVLPSVPDDRFGKDLPAAEFAVPAAELPLEQHIERWIEELSGANAGWSMWRLYRVGRSLSGKVRSLLDSSDENVAWRAAQLLAGWGDAAAQPRLLKAVATREEGPEYAADPVSAHDRHRLVPRWWVALALLRLCGNAQCLPVLARTAADPGLQLHARVMIAQVCERVAQRGLHDEGSRRLVQEILAELVATPAPHAAGVPTRHPVTGDDTRHRHQWNPVIPRVEEDSTWQVHYAVARARRALGLEVKADAERFLKDPRAIVRRAFAHLMPS